MSEIKAVVFVRDHTQPLERTVVVGECPGPWPTAEAAVDEVLHDGQRYRVSGDVILAQPMPDEDTSRAAAALGRLGGKAGTGESKRRGDSDHYRAIRRRDYVADRRQYLTDGRRNRTSGGWAVMRWDAERRIWIEPTSYYQTRREALEALRNR